MEEGERKEDEVEVMMVRLSPSGNPVGTPH